MRGQTVQNTPSPSSTWLYGPTQAGAFEPFGAACGGSLGAPSLDAELWQRPYIGSLFHLRLDRMPGSIALAALGWSNTSWFGVVPLPASLAPLGYPRCALAVQTDDVRVLPLAQGKARWSTPIPAEASLVGLGFFAQALAFDPLGADGLAMTRGGACIVGGL